jgi:[ribosomal protein S18]-alanine N-acetyltransferase
MQELSVITIREACPADVPAMITLEHDAAAAAHWRDEDYWRIFADRMPRRMAWVVEVDRCLAGFIVVSSIRREWEIENIVVADRVRRRGLGTSLLAEFMVVARAQKAIAVFLEVRETNRPARALYEKWGFVEVGRRKGYYSGPGEDALVYRYTLTDMAVPQQS